ncbi:MAG: DHH family phosphoesterase [Candidatus Nealsonbacteria bacterium]
MEIKNLDKAAKRILKGISNKETIILYGDADLDGVSSVIILKEAIKSIGGFVSDVYFPDREKDGYGINMVGLKQIKKFAPALLVVMDLGIGNIKEVLLAKEMGFTVIIVDHHEILDKLPKADIIVDPKQKGDKYPFKTLAAVGLVYRLTEKIMGEKLKGELKKSFLELTALATVADMMPKEADNRYFIEEGLPFLVTSLRPGIKIFWDIDFFKEEMELSNKVSKIISILNIRDVKNGLPGAYRLLTTSSPKEAQDIIETLFKKHKVRRQKIESIVEEVDKRIADKKETIIFEGAEDFESILISSAASILVSQHLKPVFLYKKMVKESLGTVRCSRQINSVLLMKKCSKLLMTYGGHPQASGFRIVNENLDKFKECLTYNLNKMK